MISASDAAEKEAGEQPQSRVVGYDPDGQPLHGFEAKAEREVNSRDEVRQILATPEGYPLPQWASERQKELQDLREGVLVMWAALAHADKCGYLYARTALRRAGAARVHVAELPDVEWPPPLPTAADCHGYPNPGEWQGEG